MLQLFLASKQAGKHYINYNSSTTKGGLGSPVDPIGRSDGQCVYKRQGNTRCPILSLASTRHSTSRASQTCFRPLPPKRRLIRPSPSLLTESVLPGVQAVDRLPPRSGFVSVHSTGQGMVLIASLTVLPTARETRRYPSTPV